MYYGDLYEWWVACKQNSGSEEELPPEGTPVDTTDIYPPSPEPEDSSTGDETTAPTVDQPQVRTSGIKAPIWILLGLAVFVLVNNKKR